MIYFAALSIVLAATIVLLDVRDCNEREKREQAFSGEREKLMETNVVERAVWAEERRELMAANDEERKAWVKERRDLNNRIQIPEAAPYLADDEPGADRDDLPVLPEFTVDPEEMERAKQTLEQAGYS